jgi:exopolysaccharide production protein ExoZ
MCMLVSVQVLRAVAAIAVAVAHFGQVNGIPDPGLSFGAAGVDIFFLISGFIMVHSSARHFAKPMASRIFIVRRLARIVPLYWTVTSFGFLLFLFLVNRNATLTQAQVACSFLFLPCGSDTGAPIYGVGWTLNYEMFFYAIFAFVLFLPRRMAIASLGLVLALGITIEQKFSLSLPFLYWFNPIVLEFSFGATLGLLYVEGLRAPPRMCAVIIALGVISFSLICFLWGGYVSAAWSPEPYLPRAVALGVPALCIVSGCVLSSRVKKSHGLFSKVFVKLGDASYSIYLLHPLIGFFVVVYGWRFGNQYLSIAADFAFLLPMSLLSYSWFERPAQRLLIGLKFSGNKAP